MKAKIIKVIKETENISSFRFEPEQNWDWKPGAWMYVRLGEDLKHHFTISSSPTEQYLQITTMLRAESDYKQKLFSLKEGDEVEVSGPHGSFVLDESDSSPKLFIAGGIGITPFRSMFKYMTDKSLALPIELIYSVKTKDASLFVNELTQAKVVETEVEGRLDGTKISTQVPDYASRQWWICGSASFVDSMKELAQKMGLAEEQIKTEDFPGY